MSNSILTTTTKNTTPHRKLSDEQLNPHSNNKKIRHHTKSKTMNNSILTTTTKTQHHKESETVNNSILTTTTKNTTPRTKLNDEQLIPHNNKNHNTTQKAK